MLAGHVGAALLAKGVCPRAPLGLLVLAAELPDVVQGVLVLGGVETLRIDPDEVGLDAVTPIDIGLTHGGVGTLALALLAAMLTRLVLRQPAAVCWLVGALVGSHYLLDALLEPSLPLLGETTVGLGLGEMLAGAVVADAALLVAGGTAWLARTHALDRIGRWAPIGYLALVGAVQLMTTTTAPPGDILLLAASTAGLVQVLALLAGWVDRHRSYHRDRRTTTRYPTPTASTASPPSTDPIGSSAASTTHPSAPSACIARG